MSRRNFLKGGTALAMTVAMPMPLVARRALAAIPDLPGILDALYSMPVADPLAIPQFVNPLPVIKSLGLRKDMSGGGTTTGVMGSGEQDLLGTGHITPIWGYGFDGAAPTFPGPTLVAASGVPVTVDWVNSLGCKYLLKTGDGKASVIDPTMHWAYSTVAGSIEGNGVPAVPHLHGAHSDSDYDGLPEQWWAPDGLYGRTWNATTYVYDNSQESATLWYHDHTLGITRLNVYAGLAGFYLLRDANETALIDSVVVPGGDQEIELVIQDRMFWPDGRLAYPDVPMAPDMLEPSHQPEFFGQVILVNGKAWPKLDAEARQYRFRLLNGSDSRVYDLDIKPADTSLPGPKFWVIGNDVGLLNKPVPVSQLIIAPGERYDVVVDFSGWLDQHPAGVWDGQRLVMRNVGRVPYPKGGTVDPNTDGCIMAFDVGTAPAAGVVAPMDRKTDLRPVNGPIADPPAVPKGTKVRKLMLFEATDHHGRLQPLLGTVDPSAPTDANGNPLDGTMLWDDPVSETPAFGSTEVWEIHNGTVDAHPIHLHLVNFRILNRQSFTGTIVPKTLVDMHGNVTIGGALRNAGYKGKAKPAGAYEAGLKDTAIMYPGEVTRILVTFDKRGRYVWHCHILSHEDHEMMRPFEVV